MAAEILKSILITSFIGTGLTMLLALLKPITKKLFGHNWHYYIWLAVLIVMILPIRFTIPTTVSTNNTIHVPEHNHTTQSILNTATNYDTIIPINDNVELQTPVQEDNLLTNLISNWTSILITIWILGFIVILCVYAIGYLRLLHRIHKNSYLTSCPEIRRYTTKNIRVRVCKNFNSPFIIGIFQPTLILPDTELSTLQLDNIILHEATHLKRNDVLYKWFTAFVKALHWFNPAVYYISKQITTECEISCDLSVVKNMNSTQTSDYVNTILSLLSAGKTKNIPLTTGMTGNKNTLKQRFAMIKNKFIVNKKVMVFSVISAVLIFLSAICVSGFINGKWVNPYNNTVVELNTDSRNGNTFNTLIVGVDEQNRADSIMLLRLADTSIDGFSIPRNAVLGGKTITQLLTQENGDQAVIDTIRSELSVPITYYAKIKIDLIRDLVDSVGGLTIDVPMDMKYDDPYKDLHIDLKKGKSQALNGEQVCGLLQFRRSNDGTGYPQDDLDRIKIGHQIITAFISQNKFSELALNSKDIIDSFSSNVVTNYPLKNLIKDSKLLSGKQITFSIIPGNTIVNNGIYEYKLDIPSFQGVLNPPVKLDNPPQIIDSKDNQESTVTFENTPPVRVDSQFVQTQNNTETNNTSIENTLPENTELSNVSGFDASGRPAFSSIAEAEQYFRSNGRVETDNTDFEAGSSYIKDGYRFENNSNETVSGIASNDKGEISIYFNGNMDSLVDVTFIDSETKDEVNSAIILTGSERIYKFTGLDPSRNYDVELTDKTDGEWKIEGEYLIF